MARTYIGVDVDQSRLHVVALEQEGGGLSVCGIASREIDGIDQAAEAVAQIVQDWGFTTPRMAAALSSTQLFARRVTFPFSDPRKTAAAVPLELAAHLPVDLDNYLTTFLPAGRDGDQYRFFALAFPELEVEQFLAPFNRQQLPLRFLDLTPFVYLHLLPKETSQAILVTIREQNYLVARVEEGMMQSYRHGLKIDMLSDEDLATVITREVQILSSQVPDENLPVFLSGCGMTGGRHLALIDQLPGASIPEVQFESGRLQAAYLPALALARRAALPERKGGCNLRRGRHVFRGSLAPFRRQLIAIAVLLVLTLTATLSGFWFDYAGKADALKQLEQTLQTIYKQSFPRAPVPADVPLYMASNLAGMQAESRLLGVAKTGPLRVIEAMTAGVGKDVGIEIQEFSFDTEGAALSGRTASFDAVDQLAERLRQQPVFSQVQIGDAKMSVDGSRVDFRVDFKFGAAGETP